MRKLEEDFADDLVVIGVHSGKYIAERVTENIRRAVERLGVVHPVVNDRQFRIWRAYAVTGWPTLTLIDPSGRIVAQEAGEMPAEAIAEAVAPLAPPGKGRGEGKGGGGEGVWVGGAGGEGEEVGGVEVGGQGTEVAEEVVGAGDGGEIGEVGGGVVVLVRGTDREGRVGLRFPGNVLADEATGRLFIADSGHHRLLVTRIEEGGRVAEVERVIGGGGAGLTDGDAARAQFQDLRGMALDGRILYVADRGNHAIRAVDLETGEVRTVVGTGEQGRMAAWRALEEVDTSDAETVEASRPPEWWLNSPWDVVVHDGLLYIAMAGSHQIWRLDPETGEAEAWAGSGVEDLRDGPRTEAALSQPSGLSTDGRRLFFADAEDSAIRWLDLGPPEEVHTVVGTGLFDFGDRDGTDDEVRLQHPLDVAWHDGVLYVADTYNDKIKIVDPEARSAHSWVGGEGILHEPGGVSVAGGWVYVADTNGQRVVAFSVANTFMRKTRRRGRETE